MPSERIVVPEILDHLPPDDPAAIRSRRDLRRINAAMGNDAWILSTVRRHARHAAAGITEWGAGDGHLIHRLARQHPTVALTAVDLSPAPPRLPPNIHWETADLFTLPHPPPSGILMANLFLHHFKEPELRRLGHLANQYRVLIFCEPLRSSLSHHFGNLAHPFINHVTRHDMHVSIDAGFIPHELPTAMGLAPDTWNIQEHSTWRGALHMVASRL